MRWKFWKRSPKPCPHPRVAYGVVNRSVVREVCQDCGAEVEYELSLSDEVAWAMGRSRLRREI